MRRFELATSVLAAAVFLGSVGCSPPAPPPPPPPPPAKPTPPPPKPQPTAEKPKPKPKTLQPALADLATIARPAPPAGLEPVHALMAARKWQEARAALDEKIDEHRRKGTLDVKVQAYAMLGFALWQQGEAKDAERAYRRVISYANRPEKQIQKETTDTKEAEKRLVTTMHGIGEAVFFLAEKRRAKLATIPFPTYEGSGEPQDMEKWAKRKVKPWARRRQRATERARDEYLKLTELKPLPGPWVVAAASRTGAMWADAAYQCLEGGMPETFRQEGNSTIPKGGTPAPPAAPPAADAGAAEAGTAPAAPETYTWQALAAVYRATLADHCNPFVDRAKEAYGKCKEHGATHDPKGAVTKSCTEWLANAP
jgi:hypothetical protein